MFATPEHGRDSLNTQLHHCFGTKIYQPVQHTAFKTKSPSLKPQLQWIKVQWRNPQEMGSKKWADCWKCAWRAMDGVWER